MNKIRQSNFFLDVEEYPEKYESRNSNKKVRKMKKESFGDNKKQRKPQRHHK